MARRGLDALSRPTACAQTAKAAEAAVAAANERVVTELPFADRQDFDDAMRGFIATSPDECTGSMTLFILPLGVTAHLDFVIDDGGAEVRAIATGPGTIETRVYRKQFQHGPK